MAEMSEAYIHVALRALNALQNKLLVGLTLAGMWSKAIQADVGESVLGGRSISNSDSNAKLYATSSGGADQTRWIQRKAIGNHSSSGMAQRLIWIIVSVLE